MQGVLAERPVNEGQSHCSKAPAANSSQPAEGSNIVFKPPKAKASKALWLSRQQSLVTESFLTHQGLEAKFKVPRTPVPMPAGKQQSFQTPQTKFSRHRKLHPDCSFPQKLTQIPPLSEVSQDTPSKMGFKTPNVQTPGAFIQRQAASYSNPVAQLPQTPGALMQRQGSSYSTPVAQRKEKLAFPDTPSPSPGEAALPSPLTTTNGVSQRVLPSVGLRLELEEAQEEDGSLCGICHDRDGDGLIVYCDGCDLAVHPSCYGYPLSREVPEGQWLCDRCESPSGATPPRCSLCPSSRGAMKRTTDWQWAHLSCSFFIPEVFFLGPNGNDYVHTLQVPRVRFRMLCHVCQHWHGACVHCTETGCDKWFHVTCGQAKGFAIDYRRNKHGRDIVLTFCAAHTAKWEKDKREKKRFKISSKTSVKKW